jgi:hypothetical protein
MQDFQNKQSKSVRLIVCKLRPQSSLIIDRRSGEAVSSSDQEARKERSDGGSYPQEIPKYWEEVLEEAAELAGVHDLNALAQVRRDLKSKFVRDIMEGGMAAPSRRPN